MQSTHIHKLHELLPFPNSKDMGMWLQIHKSHGARCSSIEKPKITYVFMLVWVKIATRFFKILLKITRIFRKKNGIPLIRNKETLKFWVTEAELDRREDGQLLNMFLTKKKVVKGHRYFECWKHSKSGQLTIICPPRCNFSWALWENPLCACFLMQIRLSQLS